MGRYFSDELFHLVGSASPNDDERNFDILLTVLSGQCISHPPHSIGWGGVSFTLDFNKRLEDGALLVPQVVCFCDIPREHLEVHIAKYGRFGLSIDKSYAIKHGCRPVTYIPTRKDDWESWYGRQLVRDLESTYRGFRKHLCDVHNPLPTERHFGAIPASAAEAANSVDIVFKKDIFAFIKVFNSELAADDPDYYYAEKEWRRLGNMMFEPQHVRSVLTAPGYETRLAARFPQYADRIVHPTC